MVAGVMQCLLGFISSSGSGLGLIPGPLDSADTAWCSLEFIPIGQHALTFPDWLTYEFLLNYTHLL